MATEPLDYAAYSTIVDLATLRKSLRPGLTVEAALQGLAHEQPWRPEYAQAYQRYTKHQPTRVAVAKQRAGLESKATIPQPDFAQLVRANREMGFNPDGAFEMARRQAPEAYDAWLREAGKAATGVAKAQLPAPSAWETLDGRIKAEQEAHPELSYVEASDRVNKADPTLYPASVMEHRYRPEGRSRPVEKQEPPSVEAILKMAQAQAAAEGTTTAAVLEKMATGDPAVYYEAYRRWHGSPEALREHYLREQRQG